jgi:hypothetical protein
LGQLGQCKTQRLWNHKVKGLMPIRPQVVFLQAGVLAAGRALEIK